MEDNTAFPVVWELSGRQGRSDAAFVQLRPENVLRQPTVGALCGCVVFGNQSGHSFLKCLVIQPAVYIFIYLITHVTS